MLSIQSVIYSVYFVQFVWIFFSIIKKRVAGKIRINNKSFFLVKSKISTHYGHKYWQQSLLSVCLVIKCITIWTRKSTFGQIMCFIFRLIIINCCYNVYENQCITFFRHFMNGHSIKLITEELDGYILLFVIIMHFKSNANFKCSTIEWSVSKSAKLFNCMMYWMVFKSVKLYKLFQFNNSSTFLFVHMLLLIFR